MVNPKLGIDLAQSDDSFLTQLLTGGIATDARFDGSGTDEIVTTLLADRIWAAAPKGGGKDKGEGSILGGLGDLIDGDNRF